MAKVLLKHVCKANSSYQRDVAKIARVTITIKSINAPKLEMYSSRELSNNGYYIERVGTTSGRKHKTTK